MNTGKEYLGLLLTAVHLIARVGHGERDHSSAVRGSKPEKFHFMSFLFAHEGEGGQVLKDKLFNSALFIGINRSRTALDDKMLTHSTLKTDFVYSLHVNYQAKAI
jgi:hypothetical protein